MMSKDNTVGSQEVLSKKQKAILIGLMLGDGLLELRYRYPRLRIDHSCKQKEYVDWLYSEFKGFCSERPHRLDRADSRNGKTYHHYLFSTKISSVFMKYHKLFYSAGGKIIPKSLISMLKDKLSLAIWYMDDGFRRTDCSSLYLCTSGFRLEEQKFLQRILQKLYGLETKIHFAGKNARIYFPVKSAKRFCNLIRPYVLSSFNYKLL